MIMYILAVHLAWAIDKNKLMVEIRASVGMLQASHTYLEVVYGGQMCQTWLDMSAGCSQHVGHAM